MREEELIFVGMVGAKMFSSSVYHMLSLDHYVVLDM